MMDYGKHTASAKSVLNRAVAKDGVKAKIAIFGEKDAGDCHQINGSLIFESDGRGAWECITFTRHTHSGDVWHATFTVNDEFGVALFNTPTMSSPKMNDDGTHYDWQRTFTYDAALFPRITSVDYAASC